MRLRFVKALIWISAAACVSAQAGASDQPRVGLVLGGGGARGAAHIGVLEVLEQHKIPVSCIAGTSMGALVAGAYAAGITQAEMRLAMSRADWDEMFIDNPAYSEISHQNKMLLRRLLPATEVGVKEDGIHYKGGVVSGQKIKLFINGLVSAHLGEPDIAKLPIPVSIIATDIGTGEKVVFREGSLTSAMRASMSVPGLLAPVDFQGRKLVDGGLVDNLPVSELRARCNPDIVIAVNVSSPLLEPSAIGSLLSVSAQMINILTEQNVTQSLTKIGPGDIYVKPELQGISASDFAKGAEAADRGHAALAAFSEKLRSLSADAENFAAWRKPFLALRQREAVIDAVEVSPMPRVNTAFAERHLRSYHGKVIDPAALNQDLLRMYGDGFYESTDYEVVNDGEHTTLRVRATEKPWGPDFLRFGLNFQSSRGENAAYQIRGAYQKTWLNPLGAQLDVALDFGTRTQFGAKLYQPLEPTQRFFADTSLSYESGTQSVYAGDSRIAQYRSHGLTLAAHVGINVDYLGPISFGRVQRKRSLDVEIGAPSLPRSDATTSGWEARLDFNQMDRLSFPTRGWASSLSYFNSPEGGYARADVDLRGAYAFGRNVFSSRYRQVNSPKGVLPANDAAALGGFHNLSAFAPNQILADHIRYASVGAERIIGVAPLIRGDLRAGILLEGAQLSGAYSSPKANGTIDSSALYLASETPFGPAFLGIGYSTTGAINTVLFLGTP